MCDIRTDFRSVLKLCKYINDPDLSDLFSLLVIKGLYEHPEEVMEHRQEAVEQAMLFINRGEDHSKKHNPTVMDWEQDANLVIPAINKVAGQEIRAIPYMHWWTFLGYYMEIGEGTFTTVVSIRQKLAEGKKLEKWEKEYARKNADIVQLKPKLTSEQQKSREEEKAALSLLLGE